MIIGPVQEFKVYSKTLIPDGLGSYTTEYVFVKTAKGVISNPSSKVKALANTPSLIGRYVIYTDDIDIKPDNIINIGDKYFKIIGYRNPNFRNHHLEITVDDATDIINIKQ